MPPPVPWMRQRLMGRLEMLAEGDVGVRAAIELEDGLDVVFIGDVVPDALMEQAEHTRDLLAGHQVENPVQEVRAPVEECAAGDGLVRAPPVAGVAVAREARLDR